MHAISISGHKAGHRSVTLCQWTMEDRLPLERVPLACTLGLPPNVHVRQSVGLQDPVDLDHHRVKFLIANQQWLAMIVHNFKVHPGVVWLVQSKPDVLIAGPGHSGQLGIDCPQPFVRNGVQLAQIFHPETLTFLLGLDLLWGWLNLCVGAMSMLMWPLLLPWPSRRHHARELYRDRTRGLCQCSAVAAFTPL